MIPLKVIVPAGRMASVIALVLAGCVLPALASSDPPGDNWPFLVGGGDAASVYFRCIDYDWDDGIEQCGRAMRPSKPSDCYVAAIKVEGPAVSKRRPIDCDEAAQYMFPVDPGMNRIFKRYQSELGRQIVSGEADSSIWTLDRRPQVLRQYSEQGRQEFDVDWNGWSVDPAATSQLEIAGGFMGIVGRLCKGTFKDIAVGPAECEGFASSPYGDFGILWINLKSRSARVHILGDAIGAGFGDSTSSPLIHGDAVFVGWARQAEGETQLVLSSIDLRTGRYCEQARKQSQAINLPYAIDLLDTDTGVLAAWSWDGVISVAHLETRMWRESCGARGVEVVQVAPIRQANQKP